VAPRSFFTILEKSLTTYTADLTIFRIEKSREKKKFQALKGCE
jgi:hypothetical protein